jgi:predicted RNA binding protein YcfA (HicA-like mRNA interferase family)
MKLRDLLQHLERHGAEFLREGGSHTIYVNRSKGKASAVPRHREIKDFTAKKNLQRPRDSSSLTF